MIYKFLTIEKKSPEWIVATLQEGIEGGQTFANVSINKNDKNTKAVAFANFDTFAVGQTVEGQYWANAQGKGYLFAPKPQGAPKGNGGAFKAKQIEEAQERTAGHVKEAQDNKNYAVAVAAAMRDATLVTLQALKDQPFPTDAEFIAEWKKWREFFLTESHNRLSQPF